MHHTDQGVGDGLIGDGGPGQAAWSMSPFSFADPIPELARRRHQGRPLRALGGGWNGGVEAEVSAESTLLIESALARTRGGND